MRFKPHAYQERCIDFALDRPACGLFLPMGAGKTVTTLTIISELTLFDCSRVLVIGPKRVVESTWPDEIQKWDHTRFMSCQLITAKAAKGKEPIPEGKDIYLVGKENIADLVDLYSSRWPFDLVVIDELSTFKNPKSKRFKALRRVRNRIGRLIGLTGTPAPKGIPDLWAQIYLLDQGRSLGSTLGAFRSRYLYPARQNGFVVYSWGVKPGAESAIYKQLEPLCISLKQEDCADLPDISYINVSVDLGKYRKQYADFKREKVLELSSQGENILAANAGVLTGKLAQYTSGEIYLDDGGVLTLHDLKLQALDDLMISANGQPVMVFYWFRHEEKRLLERYSKTYSVRSLKTKDDIADWNAGKIEMLLVHPASAGHGLNLQKGGHIAIWYSLPGWNLELYQQSNARIYRQGQKDKVVIYHILAKNTVDTDQIRALAKKEVTQRDLLEALKI